jgi:hypothetical protein
MNWHTMIIPSQERLQSLKSSSRSVVGSIPKWFMAAAPSVRFPTRLILRIGLCNRQDLKEDTKAETPSKRRHFRGRYSRFSSPSFFEARHSKILFKSLGTSPANPSSISPCLGVCSMTVRKSKCLDGAMVSRYFLGLRGSEQVMARR